MIDRQPALISSPHRASGCVSTICSGTDGHRISDSASGKPRRHLDVPALVLPVAELRRQRLLPLRHRVPSPIRRSSSNTSIARLKSKFRTAFAATAASFATLLPLTFTTRFFADPVPRFSVGDAESSLSFAPRDSFSNPAGVAVPE